MLLSRMLRRFDFLPPDATSLEEVWRKDLAPLTTLAGFEQVPRVLQSTLLYID